MARAMRPLPSFERMDRNEPEMRESGASARASLHWRTLAFVEPAQKSAHWSRSRRSAAGPSKCATRCRVDVRARNDLHGTGAVIAPSACTQCSACRCGHLGSSEACHPNSRSGVSGWSSFKRCVKHHFDNARPTRRSTTPTPATSRPRRRAMDERDLIRLELLAFDVAALDRFFRERFQGGFLLKREAEPPPCDRSAVPADGARLPACWRGGPDPNQTGGPLPAVRGCTGGNRRMRCGDAGSSATAKTAISRMTARE